MFYYCIKLEFFLNKFVILSFYTKNILLYDLRKNANGLVGGSRATLKLK